MENPEATRPQPDARNSLLYTTSICVGIGLDSLRLSLIANLAITLIVKPLITLIIKPLIVETLVMGATFEWYCSSTDVTPILFRRAVTVIGSAFLPAIFLYAAYPKSFRFDPRCPRFLFPIQFFHDEDKQTKEEFDAAYTRYYYTRIVLTLVSAIAIELLWYILGLFCEEIVWHSVMEQLVKFAPTITVTSTTTSIVTSTTTSIVTSLAASATSREL